MPLCRKVRPTTVGSASLSRTIEQAWQHGLVRFAVSGVENERSLELYLNLLLGAINHTQTGY
jgi:ATP-dependent Lon protease